jgi:hypothetical protein
MHRRHNKKANQDANPARADKTVRRVTLACRFDIVCKRVYDGKV